MSFVAEIVATMLGEALLERIGRWAAPFFTRFSGLITTIAWLLLPLVEWCAYRIAQRGPSPLLWFIAVLLSIGWPFFVLIISIVWFHSRQNPTRPAA